MKTVYVGLSGGVDSAVTAYLLQQEGYRVVGAFIKAWEPDFLPCTGKEDRLSAMRVAAHLGIPFKTYDLEDEYKKDVVDYFISEYKAGRTPNPDVLCNRSIKFGAFAKAALREGADYIATGHYAQTDGTQLLTAVDADKEQTYFLYTLTKEDLAHTLFPIGKYEKSEVRKIAAKAGLPNFARKDSQGLCFLGHVDMQQFLKRYLPTTKGEIKDESGKGIGEHDGAWFYTLGQRHGITSGNQERLYVVGKDVTKNELIVSTKALPQNPRATYQLRDTTWVAGIAPEGGLVGQYRYHGPMVPLTLTGDSITFSEPVLVAPGQSVVIYSADCKVCYGGGIIVA